MSNKSSSSGGIGLGGFVFLIFLTLKLAEIGPVATWSWWWVTAPLWIPLGIVLTIFLGVLVFAGLALLIAAISGKKVVRTRRIRINGREI